MVLVVDEEAHRAGEALKAEGAEEDEVVLLHPRLVDSKRGLPSHSAWLRSKLCGFLFLEISRNKKSFLRSHLPYQGEFKMLKIF